MPRKSLSQIKFEQTILTSAAVTETLSREKIALAELLAEESRLTFNQFMMLIESICTAILPQYQAIERPEIFRSQIRDRLKDEFISHCTCPPAVKYGIDIPGLGCEVCPYCAEKLDKQDIPF